jgi:hypothetical protein
MPISGRWLITISNPDNYVQLTFQTHSMDGFGVYGLLEGLTLVPLKSERRERMAGFCKRLLLVCFLLSGCAIADTHCVNPPNDTVKVRCKELSDNAFQWTIEEPNVKKSLTEYPYIRFEKGQTVTVSADGCVNVSVDAKKTDWRDYVNPIGSGIDRHYHGLIWIPGATQSVKQHDIPMLVPVGTFPVWISGVAGGIDGNEQINPEELIIGDQPPNTLSTLRLGYEGSLNRKFSCYLKGTCDTGYPEYPYLKDPPAGRCRGKARVIITVYPASTVSDPVRTLKPFDVLSARADENGFLFAPSWLNTLDSDDVTRTQVAYDCENFPYVNWLRVNRGIRSKCTQQASFDVPKVATECLLAPGFGELHGHVNWAPATFVGKLEFEEVSTDRDADFQLKAIDVPRSRFPGNDDFGKIAPILTKDSQGSAEYRNALWLEFATYETAKFQEPWKELGLRKRDRRSDFKKVMMQKFKDKTAIVTGLLNLDCVHDCHTELHPVFAMAVRGKLESDDPQTSRIVEDDSWMIFVRNAGNEGDCSSDEHFLERNGYTFFLPAPPGAVAQTPIVSNDTFRSNGQGLTWSLASALGPKRGVLVRISFTPTLSACQDIHHGQMVHVSGELHLDWSGSSVRRTHQQLCPRNYNGTMVNASEPITQEEINPVCQIDQSEQKKNEEESCTASSASHPDPATDDYLELQNIWSHNHRDNPPEISWSNLGSTLADFLGSDVGLFEELVLYNKTSQVQPNFGGRFGAIQTPLGSLEFEGAPGLSRSVKSKNGQNLNVSISDWMVGLKVQFTHQLGMFAEMKGGQVFRSASPGYATTSDFKDFHGHDSFFLVGGGIQPGNNVQARGTRITLRISVDYMHIPATGDNLVRITIGPQFQIHKRAE